MKSGIDDPKEEQLQMSIPSIYELAVKIHTELNGINGKVRELTYGPSVGDEDTAESIAERGSLQELYNVLDKVSKKSLDIRRDLNSLI